jgi:hypothetical protein
VALALEAMLVDLVDRIPGLLGGAGDHLGDISILHQEVGARP